MALLFLLSFYCDFNFSCQTFMSVSSSCQLLILFLDYENLKFLSNLNHVCNESNESPTEFPFYLMVTSRTKRRKFQLI
jgi:hypothetical protein